MESAILEDYRGIIVMSGDLLIFEIINGLMSRTDWKQAIRTPIAQIPCSPGQALANSIAYLSNECYENMSIKEFAAQTAFNLTKSIPCPIDLVAYQFESAPIMYSIEKFAWAMLGDDEAECQNNRVIRTFRANITVLISIINRLKAYKARLSFCHVKIIKIRCSKIKIFK